MTGSASNLESRDSPMGNCTSEARVCDALWMTDREFFSRHCEPNGSRERAPDETPQSNPALCYGDANFALAINFRNSENFACQRTQITSISIIVPSLQRGVGHVINVGRDAVDAGSARDERGLMRTAKSCRSDAPMLASSLR